MSGLGFKEDKKAGKRRALGSVQGRQHDLSAEPRQRKSREASKPQLLPELAELLPPDTMLYIQESTAPSVHGMSLVQEGSATIRKGRDEEGKLLIIKQTALTLDSGGRVREREVLERFCREVRVLCHKGVLYNDNIVDILGIKWDASDGRYLLTIYLECADFGNLAEFQRTHSEISWSQKNKLCLDIAAGLSMLHDCGIFHGDLKPENVLIFCAPTDEWELWEDEWDERYGFCAKLCDFGSSLFGIWSGEDTEVTLYGATPPFTAPEYDFKNKGRLHLRLLSPFDIYVFGLLVWRIALGGKTPLGVLTSEQGSNEIRWLQDLKCSPDDQFLQRALNTLSFIPILNDRLFYERILKSTLRFKVEERASTIKQMLHLLDSKEKSLPMIACWLQDLERSQAPDDEFEQQALNTFSSFSENARSYCERILYSILNLKKEDRASAIKKNLDLLDSGKVQVDDSLPIIAVDYPSGSSPQLFLQPTSVGIGGADFGTMPELFTSPIPELHSGVFRSLESMSKDKGLDVAKRAQANFNAGISIFAGIGTTKSKRLALQYLTEAASLGQVNVRAIIYRLYEACGEVLPESVPFKDWLEDGVRLGSIIACEDLPRLSRNDNPTEWIRAHYNEANDFKTSELFSRCQSGDLDTILTAQKSHKRRIDPDDSEPSCIHYIVGHDHPDLDNLIPALVSSGLLVDSQSRYSFQQAFHLPPSSYGYSAQAGAPLHWAISRNSIRAVAALMASGADPYQRNASDLSPAHVASFNHQDDILQLMIDLSGPQHVWKPSGYFKTSLMAQALKQTGFEHMVCTRGDPDSLFRVLRLLRDTVESEGVYDAELLSLAIESRRTDVLQFLLDECEINPNIYSVDPAGTLYWPLQMAVQSGHPPLLDLLIEHGLEVHRIQLTWVVSSACLEHEINSVIERLEREPHIDINKPDRTGSYPLHIAIDHGKINVVKCLLRLRADKELACAVSQGGSQLTALGRLLYKATLKSTLSILELLLHPEEGMGQPSSHTVGPMTSLHAICSAPLSVRDDAICLSCFKILWESYSDEEKSDYLNGFNEAGLAPLHCAVFNGNFSCVDELVQLGADVNLKDNHGRGQTPLDIACFLVSDKILSQWKGEPSDMLNYREGMSYIIELLKLNGAVVEKNP